MTDEIDPVIQKALEAQAKMLLAAKLDAEFGSAQADLRANDKDDPFTPTQAEEVQAASAEVAGRFETVATAAGVDENDIRPEVESQRRKDLTAALETWRKDLAIHESFLNNPEMWGGVDFSGTPLNAEEQAVHVKTLKAAVAAAEAELAS